MKALLVALSMIPVALSAAVEAAHSASQSPTPMPSQPVSGPALRNPFWPIGYEGKREVITSEVRVAPTKTEDSAKAELDLSAVEKAAAEAKARAEAAEKARIANDGNWAAARARLRFGGWAKSHAADGPTCSSVMINGNVYGDGDLVSLSHGENRFTWRVVGLSDDNRSLRLLPVKVRRLKNSERSGIEQFVKGAQK